MADEKKPEAKQHYFNVGTVGGYVNKRYYYPNEVVTLDDPNKAAHGWYPCDKNGVVTGKMIDKHRGRLNPPGEQPKAPKASEPAASAASGKRAADQ